MQNMEESALNCPFTPANLLESLQRSKKGSLDETEHASLEHYISKIQLILKATASPSQRWIEEYVSLSVMQDKENYRQSISNYIRFIKAENIVEGYHIQGLADLLSLAQANDWLTPDHGKQVLDFLIKEKGAIVLSLVNKSKVELYQHLALWQQILYVLTKAGTIIEQDQKDALTETLKNYDKSFAKSHDSVGQKLVKHAQQSLLHTQDSGPTVWKKSGMCLLSAFRNLSQAAGAIGSAPATMGVTSLAGYSAFNRWHKRFKRMQSNNLHPYPK